MPTETSLRCAECDRDDGPPICRACGHTAADHRNASLFKDMGGWKCMFCGCLRSYAEVVADAQP